MFNTDTELKSFVMKFHQLRRAGLEAHLNLHARGGRYWVGLCAQLGEAEQQPQQKPRLRRSPAYARRKERRRAARQEAAEASNSDIQAEEARTTEEPTTVEVEKPQPSSQSVSENEAEIPKWFTDNISPENKIHGNVKLVVSDQVDRIIMHNGGDRVSYPQWVRKLWTYISEKCHISQCGGYFLPDAAMIEHFDWKNNWIKFAEMRSKFRVHVFFNSSRLSIYDQRVYISEYRACDWKQSFPDGLIRR